MCRGKRDLISSGEVYTAYEAVLHDVDVEYLDVLLWFLLERPGVLDLLYHVQTLGRATENGMLAIEPRLQCTVSLTWGPERNMAEIKPGFVCRRVARAHLPSFL